MTRRTQRSPWKILLLTCLFMLVFALVFQSIPPLVGFLTASLGISHAQAGALMSLFGLPGIFISIPGGILADLYGSKRIGIIALVITSLGSLAAALSGGFPIMALGRIIAGIGALTIAIVAPQILSQRFPPQDLGKAMGVFNSVMPLGTILTLNTFGLLAGSWGWRAPLYLATAYSVLILLVFAFKFPEIPSEEKQEKPDFKAGFLYLRKVKKGVWLTGGIWMMYNAGAIAFLSFAGDYYQNFYSPAYAGFLASLLMIGALILSPAVGWFTDHCGREEELIILGGLGLAVLFFLVPRTELNPLFLGILIGICAPLIPAPVFSLLPNFLPPERLGLGYGILSTLLNLGVLAGPFLVGLFYDLFSSYQPGFNLMSLFLVGTALLAWRLRQARA
ncbi:MAG: MFS transporter [Firmicutes bacterium]|nr:MFS transporter [Bacillota bacterium]